MIVSPYVGGLVVAIATTTLAGYVFGWRWAWRPLPQGIAIQPISAVSFLALGIAVLLKRPNRHDRTGAAIAVVVAMISAATLVAIMAGHGSIVDAVSPFPRVLAEQAAAGNPIRVMPFTATSLLFLSIAIIMQYTRHGSAVLLAAGFAAITPISSMFGYVHGLAPRHADMGIVSTTLACLLVVAIMGQIAHRSPARNVLTTDSVGRLIRIYIATLTGFSAMLVTVAVSSGFDDNVRASAIECAILIVVTMLALVNAAYRLQQQERLKRLERLEGEMDPVARELDGAWDRGEMSVVYQPQIRIRDEAFVGVEALVRWTHPVMGSISPDRFIPIAEKAGLIVPLGEWVFRAACEQAARWSEGALSGVVVSINVSPLQLERPDCAERLLRIQRQLGVPARRLVVEVTEGTLIERGDQAVTSLRALHDAGMLIAIDDFGTGYSSLSSLRILPCCYLKIDRSFVTELAHSPPAAMIVRAVVGMGVGLGMKVIAEGVENAEQARLLGEAGCEKAQGYLYAKPMSPEELADWSIGRVARAAAA